MIMVVIWTTPRTICLHLKLGVKRSTTPISWNALNPIKWRPTMTISKRKQQESGKKKGKGKTFVYALDVEPM
jgi:hypothetical protein